MSTTFALAMCLTWCLPIGQVVAEDQPAADPPAADSQQADQTSPRLGDERRTRPPLEVGPLQPRLQAIQTFDFEEGPTVRLKPGHWMSTSQPMQANYDDFIGRSTIELLDEPGRPTPLPFTRFTLTTSRPVALPQGQSMRMAGDLFVPQHSTAEWVRPRLLHRDGRLAAEPPPSRIIPMPTHQYHLIVVAREPERFTFLKTTNTVRSPWEEDFDEGSGHHYEVVLVGRSDLSRLPESVMHWTSIAYVFWDDIDPESLNADQQQALVDWLHWGGRLIVSGPASLDSLEGSFLDAYLPATRDGSQQLSADDLEEWSNFWGRRSGGADLEPLRPSQPLSAIALAAHEDASETGNSGGLFFERRIGSGSIVVSAIHLSEREFINWPGYDGFLNAGLLRRPPREYSAGPYGGIRVSWADSAQERLDPQFITGMRLFARDAKPPSVSQPLSDRIFGLLEGPSVGEKDVDHAGGMAAWDDFSPVAEAAREVLLTAAGVRVPGRVFVLTCLAVYLFVLVPLNWMLFRALSRLEWAWIAVPVIALLGTIAIIRQAQLDIGFVRSQTEVAVLEVHGNHPRGLLSRFTAFYSSLSTTYDVSFEEPTAVALPFANTNEVLRFGDRAQQVVFDHDGSPRLQQLTVSSASTRLLHSEQMFPLNGTIRLGQSSSGHSQLENRSNLNLTRVAVIRRQVNAAGVAQFSGDWVGNLRAGESAIVGLVSIANPVKSIPFQSEQKGLTDRVDDNSMDLDNLIRLSYQFPSRVGEENIEEVRMIAVVEEMMPGMEVSPRASQLQGATVLVAHLKSGELPAIATDLNSLSDIDLESTSHDPLSMLEATY